MSQSSGSANPTDSETLTPESIAVQTIQDHPDLVKKYAAGDLSVLGTLQERAQKLAAGRVSEKEVKETLLRKLGAGL